MGKSLTEVAKAILMNESNDPTPDRDATSMTPNKASLKPGSKSVDPSPLSNSAQDLGPALVNNTDIPPSAKASGIAKKDTSGSSQSRKGTVSSEPKKSQSEVMEEDVELEEGLEEGMEEMPTSSPVAPKRNVPVPRPAAGVGPGNNKVMQEEDDVELSEELEAFIDMCLTLNS